MEDCKCKWDWLWIVGEDFNMVLHSNEISGEHSFRSCAKKFKETMDKLDLVDILLLGDK